MTELTPKQVARKSKLEKIEDFGDRIYGARKDFYITLEDFNEMSEIAKAKNAKKDKVWPVKKHYYEQLVEDGVPKVVAYFRKRVRDAMPNGIDRSRYWLNVDEAQKNLVNVLNKVREKTEKVKSVDDIFDIVDFLMTEGFIQKLGATSYRATPAMYGVKLSAAMLNIPSEILKLKISMNKDMFMFTEREKALATYIVMQLSASETGLTCLTKDVVYGGKKALKLSYPNGCSYFYPLRFLELKEDEVDNYEVGKWFVLRHGSVWGSNLSTKEEAVEEAVRIYAENSKKPASERKRKEQYKLEAIDKNQILDEVGKSLKRNATPDDYLNGLKLRGGQFGNWESAADRQLNMNCAYNSLQNVAIALGIENSDVSLNGELGIAFGARGKGRASAHFEAGENVINLTKMKGAGALVHEWFHALDYYLNQVTNKMSGNWCATQGYVKGSMSLREKAIAQAIENVVDAMKYAKTDSGKEKSQFWKDAEALDEKFSRQMGGGYWAEIYEMFARAGASYMHDMYDALNIRDSYGVGHARGRQGYDSNGNRIPSICPVGEDAVRIDAAFDELFTVLIKQGVFTKRSSSQEDSTSLAEVREAINHSRECKTVIDAKAKKASSQPKSISDIESEMLEMLDATVQQEIAKLPQYIEEAQKKLEEQKRESAKSDPLQKFKQLDLFGWTI